MISGPVIISAVVAFVGLAIGIAIFGAADNLFVCPEFSVGTLFFNTPTNFGQGYNGVTYTAGVFTTSGLQNDTTTRNTLVKYLDANDLLVLNFPQDYATIKNFSNLQYRIVQGRSTTEVQTCATIPTNGTWTVKPQYCNYDDEQWAFTPASEQANPAGAVHNASVIAHGANLKLSWSPVSGFSTLIPWVTKMNLTDIDLWILQVQGGAITNPTLFGSVQYSVNQAVNYKNALTPTYVTHLVPITGSDVTAHSVIAALRLDSPATSKTAGGYAGTIQQSGTCAARSTTATLHTGFTSGDNIIIAPQEFISSDINGKSIIDRLYNDTKILSAPAFPIPIKNAGATNMSSSETIVYLDKNAPANANYTLQSCTSADHVSGTGSILALHGISNAAFGNGTTQTITGNVTTVLVSKATTIPAGNNIILAQIELKNGANAQTINTGNLKILNNAGATIWSNKIPIILSTSANAEKANSYRLAIAYDSNAPINPTYQVTILDSKVGTQADANILIFPGGAESYYSNSGNVTATGGQATEINRIATSFAPHTRIAIIDSLTIQNQAGQVCSGPCVSNSVIEYPTYFGHFSLDESLTLPLNTNTLSFTPIASGGNAGDSNQVVLVWNNVTTTHNPSMVIVPQFSLILKTPAQITSQRATVTNASTSFNLIYRNNPVANGSSTNDNLKDVIQLYEGLTYNNGTNQTTTSSGIQSNSCNQAKSTAWTVLAILPFALFMGVYMGIQTLGRQE